MGIINDNFQSDVDDFVKGHRKAINAFFVTTLDQFRQLGHQVWSNSQFTPEQIVEAYGTDAAELFRLSAYMKGMFEGITGQPLEIAPPNYAITVNADGTVTLDPQSSSSSVSSDNTSQTSPTSDSSASSEDLPSVEA